VDKPFLRIAEARIVYEQGGVVVAVKPAGMHCAPGGEAGTLCSWLFSLRPELAHIAGHAPGEGGLLHRLDAATSGLVAFASSDAAFISMAANASAGGFRKTYRALGVPGPGGLPGSRPLEGVPEGVDSRAWMTALRNGRSEMLAGMVSNTRVSCRFRPYGPGATMVACALPDDEVSRKPGGKAWTRTAYTSDFGLAHTHDGAVLVEISLTRGFRHQIRAQMAWLGLALKGDTVYGDDEGFGNLYLQASRIEFDDPCDGQRIVVDLDACH
jgi:23S rRNA pseudouridine1911/1915/1917 synthase